MQILNRPLCKKCEKLAMTLFNGIWLCGDCMMKANEKLRKLRENILLEE